MPAGDAKKKHAKCRFRLCTMRDRRSIGQGSTLGPRTLVLKGAPLVRHIIGDPQHDRFDLVSWVVRMCSSRQVGPQR